MPRNVQDNSQPTLFWHGIFATSVAALALASGCSREPAPKANSPVLPAPSVVVPQAPPPAPERERSRVIVFVWDGLRPDSVDASLTPHLAGLRDGGGVDFTDHHSVFPTFTMMNAASLAVGGYPAAHGFYGNTEYQPGPSGKYASGHDIDFSQPVFTEDYGVLRALDTFYAARGERLLASETLFEAAQRAGLTTAVVGKTGPAYLTDYRAGGLILDENVALPLELASALQAAGMSLPENTTRAYAAGQAPALTANNGNPTGVAHEKLVQLRDEAAMDPRADLGSANSARNDYLLQAFLEVILPRFGPALSLVWLRDPDSTQHQFGPGTANARHALAEQDARLGQLLSRLEKLGLRAHTDVLVVSDHGHSTVAGSAKLFPLRGFSGPPDGKASVGAIEADGYSVSGDVRTADLLARAGIPRVYDGAGCALSPVLAGVRANAKPVYPTLYDKTGKLCGKAPADPQRGTPYSTKEFFVPKVDLPSDAIVIAANGGSEYFYLLDHSPARLRRVVLALQERAVYGAIFVHSRYGAVPGTQSLTSILAEGKRESPPTPDLIVSFDWDDSAVIGGSRAAKGTEYASMFKSRGMHGSFSPIDVHNTLIASGPHFKAGFASRLPSGNVDVAPTVAAILGIPFSPPHGRVLREAMPEPTPAYTVTERDETSSPAPLKRVCAPDDPPCARPAGPATYRFTLKKKVLTLPDGKAYEYFDQAKATRD